MGFSLDLGRRSFACLAGKHGDQLIHWVEAWCRRSFRIEPEKLFVLHVQVGACAPAGCGDVERLTRHGVVDEHVGSVDGAALLRLARVSCSHAP